MSLCDKIKATLSKCRSLGEMIDVLKAATENPPASAPSLLDRLLAGEFNNAPDMLTYINKLYEVSRECEANQTEFTDEVIDKLGEVVGDFVVAYAVQPDSFERELQICIKRTKVKSRKYNPVSCWAAILNESFAEARTRQAEQENDKRRKAFAGHEKEFVGKSFITSGGIKREVVGVGKVKGTVKITEILPWKSDQPIKPQNWDAYYCDVIQRSIQKYEANKAKYNALFEQYRQARIDKENAEKHGF